MATEESPSTVDTVPDDSMSLLFVEMGVGYDHDWEYVTAAAMRACRDAMSSNGIPAFHLGSIPGVSANQMKLQIKLGVPRSLHESLDIERIKSFFPYGMRKGEIVKLEVVDGGLICSNGMQREGREDEKNDCYVVNAVVYVGY